MHDTEISLRASLCRIGRSFHARGLSGGASGNLSLRLPNGADGAGGGFLATPTGCSLGDLEPDQLSLLDATGTHVSGPKPTKEVFVHLACYEMRPDCAAVVHLHSPYAVAWSCLADLDMADAVPSLTPYGLMRYGRVALSPYRKPGSPALAEDMRRLMPKHKAVLLANHGAIVMGKNIVQAGDNMEELESSCRLALSLRGLPVRVLTQEEQEELLASKA